MSNKFLLTGITLLSAVLITAITPAAWAQPDNTGASPIEERNTNQIPPLPPGPPSDLDALVLPPVSESMSNLASQLTEKFSTNPQFASAEVPADRKKIIVHWNGVETKRLKEVLSNEPDIPIEIRQTKLNPGKLRDAAEKLRQNDPTITSVSVKHDGSGIDISVNEKALAQRSKKNKKLELERLADAPITLSEGQPKPANTRQSDAWHMGGARIWGWNANKGEQAGGCSSAFAVVERSTNKQGVLTANHCPVMSGATHYTRKDSAGTYYFWGPIVRALANRDGAVIDTGTSHPFVWTGAYTSNTYAAVHGYAYGYVGQELCTSGSYSGLTCGNIIQDVAYSYTYENYPQAMIGYKSRQINGEHSVGNGDSGGAAYEVVSSGSGTKRLAIGVISGTWGGLDTATCKGVPGSATGRTCSENVLTTSVGDIGTGTGWYVPAR